jgi:hypothetical protein
MGSSNKNGGIYCRITPEQDRDIRLIQARTAKAITDLGLPAARPSLVDVLSDLVARGIKQYKKDSDRVC